MTQRVMEEEGNTMAEEISAPEPLTVIALGDHSWRVSDQEFDPADSHCLLAYVEERNRRFAVLMLAPRPGVHAECSTMEEALATIAAQREVGPDHGRLLGVGDVGRPAGYGAR